MTNKAPVIIINGPYFSEHVQFQLLLQAYPVRAEALQQTLAQADGLAVAMIATPQRGGVQSPSPVMQTQNDQESEAEVDVAMASKSEHDSDMTSPEEPVKTSFPSVPPSLHNAPIMQPQGQQDQTGQARPLHGGYAACQFEA